MTTFFQSLFRDWGYRWHAIRVIEKRNSQSTFYGIGIYISIAVALFLAAVLLSNTLGGAEQSDVLVVLEPLFGAVFLSTAVVSIYIALMSAISASRERDMGTLEVLFYGPVDEAAFVLGKFLAQVKVYATIALITLVWANIVTWLLNFSFSIDVLIVLATSVLTAAAVIAFGLMVAMLGGRARNAVIVFILTVFLLLGFQVAEVFVTVIQRPESATASDPILVVRMAVVIINSVLKWLSPYAQLQLSMDALSQNSWGDYFIHLIVMGLQSIVMLLISIYTLHRKGARG